jgi:predicted lipoprotein with Yx(FWY)xxD motif
MNRQGGQTILSSMRITIALGLLVAALALAACGDDDDDGTAAAPASEEEAMKEDEGSEEAAMKEDEGSEEGAMKEDEGSGGEQMKGEGTEVRLADSQFGSILFDGEDQAIYLFDKETSSKPDCYGGCAEAWPPVLTEGEPVAADGVDESLLGTTKRDDGSEQVTYDGHPLYYYAHEGPGEVLCHGVDEFGGLWLVVGKSGEALPA